MEEPRGLGGLPRGLGELPGDLRRLPGNQEELVLETTPPSATQNTLQKTCTIFRSFGNHLKNKNELKNLLKKQDSYF